MQEQTFIDILDLAQSDMRAEDPSILGIIMIAVAKSADDEMQVKIGANVPPDIVREALRVILERNAPMHRAGPTQ